MLNGKLFYTKILEVNLFAFAYRLFHEDFSSINGAANLCVYFFLLGKNNSKSQTSEDDNDNCTNSFMLTLKVPNF